MGRNHAAVLGPVREGVVTFGGGAEEAGLSAFIGSNAHDEACTVGIDFSGDFIELWMSLKIGHQIAVAIHHEGVAGLS